MVYTINNIVLFYIKDFIYAIKMVERGFFSFILHKMSLNQYLTTFYVFYYSLLQGKIIMVQGVYL